MALIEILGRPLDGDSPYQEIKETDTIANPDALNAISSTQTSDYSIVDTDDIILADESGGAVTITLPAPTWAGETYTVKRISAAANGVTIDTADTATIDGATSQSLAAQWDFIKVVSDGTDWFIIAN